MIYSEIRLIVLLSLITLVNSCALWTHGWEEVLEFVQITPEREQELQKTADTAWEKRHFQEDLKIAIDAYEQLAKSNPKNKKLISKIGRAYFLLADTHYTLRGQSEEATSAFEKGMKWSERALAINQDFKDIVSSHTGSIEKALDYLEKDDQEALYWLAANMGKWSISKGQLASFKYQLTIEQMMDKVNELGPNYFYGAVERYRGVFYAKVPGIRAEYLKKSLEHFNNSLSSSPNYFGTSVLMAEYYAVKAEDKKLFKSLLDKVLNTNPSIIPEIMPENYLEQEKARYLLKKVESLF